MTEAVLLVGGQGTRLRPLTINTPKPMLPVAGVPFTVHQITRARDAGVTRIVLATSYRAEMFRAFIDGTDLGIEVVIATEDEPLGHRRRDPARAAVPGELRRRAGAHLQRRRPQRASTSPASSGTTATRPATSRSTSPPSTTRAPTAWCPTDHTGRVTAFLEKPKTDEEIVTNNINAGCYVFKRSVIDAIPAGRPVSVERETFPGLLADGALVTGVVDKGYWLDLGTPLSFVQGSCDLVLGAAPSPAVPAPATSSRSRAPRSPTTPRCTAARSSAAAPSSVPGAVVNGAVVFDGAEIAEGAHVMNSIVGVGAVIGAGTVLRGAVIGDGAVIGRGNELLDGVRVWPGVELADGSVRFSADA